MCKNITKAKHYILTVFHTLPVMRKRREGKNYSLMCGRKNVFLTESLSTEKPSSQQEIHSGHSGKPGKRGENIGSIIFSFHDG